jgi:hypothetical protein
MPGNASIVKARYEWWVTSEEGRPKGLVIVP